MDKLFYPGADNWLHLRLGRDIYTDDGTTKLDQAVDILSLTDVEVTLRPEYPAGQTAPPTVTRKRSDQPASFSGNRQGRLMLRLGEFADLLAGPWYQVQLKLYDADNPDGWVHTGFVGDATTPTLRVRAAL